MKILIIDDDVQIREGITEGIDWNSLGIEEVKNAQDGISGLAIFKVFRPDIILADVRMPQMDGLEFLKRVKELDAVVKVIMISGYSDFEYLKRALQYGAEDYELKPIKVKSLIKLINKTKEKIMKERFSKAKADEYQSAYEKNFIREVIRGELVDPNVIAGYFQPRFKAKDVKLVICGVLSPEGQKDKSIDYSSFRKMILDYFTALEEDILCFRIKEDEYVLLMPALPSSLYVYNQQNVMKLCCLALKERAELKEKGLSFSLGISLEVNISQVMEGHEMACDSLKERIWSGRGSVHIQTTRSQMMKNIREEEERRDMDMAEELQKLIPDLAEAYMKKDLSLVWMVLDIAKQKIIAHRSDNRKPMLEFLINSCIHINSSYIKNGERDKPFMTAAIHEMLAKCYFYEDYMSCAKDIFRQALEEERKEIQQRYSIPIANAVTYINVHYMENLTADFMGDYIEKTPNYFSHLFKKEVGASFKEYLNMIRMEKAKELLLKTDLKIYEVAEKVGFHDSIYFSQAFKKTMGCSPAECRRR